VCLWCILTHAGCDVHQCRSYTCLLHSHARWVVCASVLSPHLLAAFSRTLCGVCISAAPTPACCILTHAGCDVHQCSPTPACIGIPSHVFGQGERVVHVRTLGDYPFGPPPLPFLPFASPSHRPPPLPTMQVLRPLVMVFAALVAALHIRVDLAVSANALELVVRR
jgi:hypothetical protein